MDFHECQTEWVLIAVRLRANDLDQFPTAAANRLDEGVLVKAAHSIKIADVARFQRGHQRGGEQDFLGVEIQYIYISVQLSPPVDLYLKILIACAFSAHLHRYMRRVFVADIDANDLRRLVQLETNECLFLASRFAAPFLSGFAQQIVGRPRLVFGGIIHIADDNFATGCNTQCERSHHPPYRILGAKAVNGAHVQNRHVDTSGSSLKMSFKQKWLFPFRLT